MTLGRRGEEKKRETEVVFTRRETEKERRKKKEIQSFLYVNGEITSKTLSKCVCMH